MLATIDASPRTPLAAELLSVGIPGAAARANVRTCSVQQDLQPLVRSFLNL